jgi:peptide methionine sulfoxide reductase MsrA
VRIATHWILKDKGFKIVTKLNPATKFWKAEDYHQNYYEKKKNNLIVISILKSFKISRFRGFTHKIS